MSHKLNLTIVIPTLNVINTIRTTLESVAPLRKAADQNKNPY